MSMKIVFTHAKCYRKLMVYSNENVTEGTLAMDDPMTIDERRKYLHKVRKRYFPKGAGTFSKADREERNGLLDEMQAVTGLLRKSLNRLMRGDLASKPRRKQRGPTYGLRVRRALGVIAESLDYVCAERLQPNLVWMARHLTRHGELEVSPSTMEKLGRISISTVRRLLKDLQEDQPRLPRKGSEQANRYLREVPTKCILWSEQEPGQFEVDLVHHCDISPSGQYVHSLQMIDVATGWSERVAVLGRSYRVMQDGCFERIQARLSLPIQELHPDNDSTFFNNFLMKFWQDRVSGLQFSRSRPYQKIDIRFVEQPVLARPGKNDTRVRAYLGYDRLDTVAQTNLLNLLYDRMWLYYNFFQPVMRLQEKIMVSVKGGRARTRRRYDRARTPFDRLCDTEVLDAPRKAELRALRNATNPRQLREEIYALLDELMALPEASSKDRPGEGMRQSIKDRLRSLSRGVNEISSNGNRNGSGASETIELADVAEDGQSSKPMLPNGKLEALEPGLDPVPMMTAALEALGGGIENFGFQLHFGEYAPSGRMCEFRVKGVGMSELSRRITAWLDAQEALESQIQVVDEGSGELTIYLLDE